MATNIPKTNKTNMSISVIVGLVLLSGLTLTLSGCIVVDKNETAETTAINNAIIARRTNLDAASIRRQRRESQAWHRRDSLRRKTEREEQRRLSDRKAKDELGRRRAAERRRLRTVRIREGIRQPSRVEFEGGGGGGD